MSGCFAALMAGTLLAQGGEMEEAFASAVVSERALDFPGAVRACSLVVQADAGGARAASCARRIEAWESLRDPSGGFVGLVTLEHVRRTHLERGGDAGRTDLNRLVAGGDMSPALEAEVAIWLARDALERLGDGPLAIEQADRALARQEGVDPARIGQLVSLRARALVETGALAAAREAEQDVRVGSTRLSVVEAAILTRRRRQVTGLAGIGLGAFLVMGLPLAASEARRQWPVLWGLLPIGVGTLGAFWIAERWEPGAGRAPLLAGFLFCLVHVSALGLHAWSQRRSGRGERWVRVGAVVATLSGLWVAVAWTGSYGWMGW